MANLKENKVAVIDIETTGTSRKKDLFVEIGIVELDMKTGETKIIFDTLVKEPKFGERYRNSWIFRNSNLTFEHLENAPLFGELKKELSEIVSQYPITAFNKSFDLGFLKAREINIPNELPCIMMTSTKVCKIPNKNNKPGYKRPKVQEAWDFFFPSSEYIEEHRAADDAIHEAKILYELHKRGQYFY